MTIDPNLAIIVWVIPIEANTIDLQQKYLGQPQFDRSHQHNAYGWLPKAIPIDKQNTVLKWSKIPVNYEY